jgi:hypothetical protein
MDTNIAVVARSAVFFVRRGSLRDRWRLSHVALVAGGSGVAGRCAGRARASALWHRSTFQPAPFGRVYAAYGAVFVVMSLVWARTVDGFAPDRFDLIGAGLCLAGVAVIMYSPR